MKNTLIAIAVLILISACNTAYEPFANSKEKRESIRQIKSTFLLKKLEYNKIKNEDSILYSLAKSIKLGNKFNRVERRLDSFILGNYSKGELIAILEIDRNLPNYDLELDRSGNTNALYLENMDELKKFINEDRKKILKQSPKVKVVKDSTKQKKQ